ncbi:MAG: DNA alkylation repair protein [Candidatus Saccharibacteria bacterium]|nr:DNA alkylation repair protein [Candidatus Saccharibacteria bacterium]
MNKFELILRERLEDLRDEAYGDFVAKGIPGVPREKILGVRVPEIRGAAAYALGEIFPTEFLQDLPHYFLEYDYAHAEIISQMNNFEECVSELNKFLPYVNNWAVCDTMNPKIFRKNLDKVLPLAFEWMESEQAFTVRFGMLTMMRYFLDEQFSADFLNHIVKVGWRAENEKGWTEEERYYVRMMVAWYFATALAKQWEAALVILTEEKLPAWTHNKAIQKACESRRITPEQKDLLRGFKC